MKYNIIGDIHGRTSWKQLMKDDCINIFVGDYFSPYFPYPFEDQQQNFLDIITYKSEHPETILLVGNHDEDHWHINEHYSRHDFDNELIIREMFNEFKDLFQIAYATADNNVLISHAGVSIVWYIKYKYKELCALYDLTDTKFSNANNIEDAIQIFNNEMPIKQNRILLWQNNYYLEKDNKIILIDISPKELSDFINDLWRSENYRAFTFKNNSDYRDYCGTSYQQSPLWIRTESLQQTNIFKYKEIAQVVGHTQYNNISIIKDNFTEQLTDQKTMDDSEDNIICVDCLGFNKESLLYENKTFKLNRI